MSKSAKFIIKRGSEVVATRVELADNFLIRAKGLMFSSSIGDRDGLLFEPCSSIHTCFMNYPIDVVFLSRENKVVRVFKALKPWRMTRIYFTAAKTLEMMGGTLSVDLRPGDQLEIECIS
ncbi:MAG: DUF192 domain-containing protein [Bacteriovoracaceae bacterium]|nr:DUF192 domain-containing protein [Bacteriovoracaceae bacterium]